MDARGGKFAHMAQVFGARGKSPITLVVRSSEYHSSRLLTRADSEKLREKKKLSEILMSLDPSISATKFKKISLFLSDFA